MRHAGMARVSGPYTASVIRAKQPRSHQCSSASVAVGRLTGPKTTTPGPGSARTFARISLAVRFTDQRAISSRRAARCSGFVRSSVVRKRGSCVSSGRPMMRQIAPKFGSV
jgi:hypothetical protein